MKQIKVCVGFDNFEMGLEKQEISRLKPHVSHQLSPLLALATLLGDSTFFPKITVSVGPFVSFCFLLSDFQNSFDFL